MATYVFKCPQCGHWNETAFRDPAPGCASDLHQDEVLMVRDYRAEGVGFAISSLTRERTEGTNRELRDVFLETAEEAATPEDPDGSKYIRQWNETHEPKEVGESKALRPEMPLHAKKVL